MPDTLRQRIIREDAFVRVLTDRLRPYLRLLNLLQRRESSLWVKRHYHELVVQSHDMETFLDDYDARNNKSFAYLTELIASLRGMGKVAIALKHLVGRFPRYHVALTAEGAGEFFVETEHTTRFLNRSIKSIIRSLRGELESIGVAAPEDSLADASVADDGLREVLPHNIDEEDVYDEEQKIAEIATRYIEAGVALGEVVGRVCCEKTDPGLRERVLRHMDEERARELEARIHSIQSKYDTYVKATAIESRNPDLPRLRGHVSLALHLLEMATELIHFYVRHENDVRYEPAKARVAELVDKTLVLDRAVNYALAFAARVIQSGRPFAERVLSSFVQTSELIVEIPEGNTLHARPMSLIVKIVNEYGTLVEMEVGEGRANAGSIMDMIFLVGSHPDARSVTFRGDERPLRDLRMLFESGLGERGLDTLPAELAYLR